jgi:serine/threonine protein phosphatase 1
MQHLVFAIGDIHGRLDLFERALRAIAARAVGATPTVVCLGDYVDRGPESAGVVERLIELEGPDFVCLKGNHEAMMIEAFGAGRHGSMSLWKSNGGIETLESYGGVRGVPPAHLAWMRTLPLWWTDSRRYYVHAGVEPGLAMAEQEERVLLWIRDRFLLAPAELLPGHVVHGHTPRWRGKPDPATCERLPQRTNLDSGAWMTNVLSVGVFDAAETAGPLEVLSIT